MLYTALYMAATRTQIYLTSEQRRLLDEVARRTRKTLAAVIREAVDRYLADVTVSNRDAVLKATYGALPDLEVPPRDEWDRGYG